jgi:hypothetical protein
MTGRVRDLAGIRFGLLVAIERSGTAPGTRGAAWICVCDCGARKTVRGANLTSGRTKSCGCTRGEFKDLTGLVQGRLTVLRRVENDTRGRSQWLCRCSCGATKIMNGSNSCRATSCGCESRIPRASLAGQSFGLLTAVRDVGKDREGRRLWLCTCFCGGAHTVPASRLTKGHTRSCGCIRGNNKQNTVYLLRNPDDSTVKIGITTVGPNAKSDRFGEHRRDGYTDRVFLRSDLPGGAARRIELDVLENLRALGARPIRGVEYFPGSYLAPIVSVLSTHHLLS